MNSEAVEFLRNLYRNPEHEGVRLRHVEYVAWDSPVRLLNFRLEKDGDQFSLMTDPDERDLCLLYKKVGGQFQPASQTLVLNRDVVFDAIMQA